MDGTNAWETFVRTGQIGDYLKYAAQNHQVVTTAEKRCMIPQAQSAQWYACASHSDGKS